MRISDWSSDVCSSDLLRSGSTRKWWDVPPESVYAFTFYVFQTLNRWPTNGEEDYARNLHTLSPYLTPSCQAFLRADYDYRRSTGERSEEHTSELQSLMRISYAVFCLKNTNITRILTCTSLIYNHSI